MQGAGRAPPEESRPPGRSGLGLHRRPIAGKPVPQPGAPRRGWTPPRRRRQGPLPNCPGSRQPRGALHLPVGRRGAPRGRLLGPPARRSAASPALRARGVPGSRAALAPRPPALPRRRRSALPCPRARPAEVGTRAPCTSCRERRVFARGEERGATAGTALGGTPRAAGPRLSAPGRPRLALRMLALPDTHPLDPHAAPRPAHAGRTPCVGAGQGALASLPTDPPPSPGGTDRAPARAAPTLARRSGRGQRGASARRTWTTRPPCATRRRRS